MGVLRYLLPVCIVVFLLAPVLVMEIVPEGWGIARASSKDSLSTGLSLKEALRDAKETQQIGSGIRVAIKADKTNVAPGEPVQFSVDADKDCHLTFLHFGIRGGVSVLWPNRTSNWDDRVRAGHKIVVPSPGQAIKLDFDGSVPEEIVVAIATDRPGTVLGRRNLATLPGGEIKVIRENPEAFMKEVAHRLIDLGPEARWGADELIIRVASSPAPTGSGPSPVSDDNQLPPGQVRVTMHIYSGRPDPSWVLPADKAQELVQRLRGAKSIPGGGPERDYPIVGYQGFTIEGLDGLGLASREVHLMGKTLDTGDGHFLAVGDDLGLEQWLMNTAGDALPLESREFALDLMAKSRQLEADTDTNLEPEERSLPLVPEGEIEVFPDIEEGEELKVLKDAGFVEKRTRLFLKSPTYEPGKWNRSGVIKKNNCYNYGTNRMTFTFAQPGTQCGRMLRQYTCRTVREAAICDGLIPVRWSPSSPGDTSPATGSQTISDAIYGHLAAFIVSPGYDYHWYRLDNTRLWSHKCGFSRATDKDSKGRKIRDPRTCSRPYRDFCGYYFVPTHIRVKGELKELSQVPQ